MKYAYILDSYCVNVIEAEQGFVDGYLAFSGMDEIVECPEGMGIQDRYADGEWTKAPQPPAEPFEPGPDPVRELQRAMNIILGVADDGE